MGHDGLTHGGIAHTCLIEKQGITAQLTSMTALKGTCDSNLVTSKGETTTCNELVVKTKKDVSETKAELLTNIETLTTKNKKCETTSLTENQSITAQLSSMTSLKDKCDSNLATS